MRTSAPSITCSSRPSRSSCRGALQTPLDPRDLTLAVCIPGLGAGAGAGNPGRQVAAGLTEGP